MIRMLAIIWRVAFSPQPEPGDVWRSRVDPGISIRITAVYGAHEAAGQVRFSEIGGKPQSARMEIIALQSFWRREPA